MPATSKTGRPNRKGQFACEFCRVRKLRCDRPLPCTSCRSRGKTCRFTEAQSFSTISHDEFLTGTSSVSLQGVPTSLTPVSSSTKEDLLAEIQTLRKRTEDLESRIQQSSSRSPWNAHSHCDATSPLQQDTPSDACTNASTTHLNLRCVGDTVARLQSVSMGRILPESIPDEHIAFRIDSIHLIPQRATYTTVHGKTVPCIWIPYRAEALELLEVFVRDVCCIQQVVHQPSLLPTLNEIYHQIENGQNVALGSMLLLLSINAVATHIWTPQDETIGARLFQLPAEAHTQTALWIKASYTVLNASQTEGSLTLETIMGIAVLSFVIANLEGVSLRHRALKNTGLMLGRELGLHRIDHESNASDAKTLRAEMGRRVWWYLVGTDWLMASRYRGPDEGVYNVHPLQMIVNKPLNTNDIDWIDNEMPSDLPTSQWTDMSYFLQRIQLAEISRNIVDRSLTTACSISRPSHFAHVMAMDVELDRMIRELPLFFQIDTYEQDCIGSSTSRSFLQAYMLNSLLNTDRCKLHLAYLVSEPGQNPTYTYSRNVCLLSARRIVRAELQLLRSKHSFVRIRLRLAAILYSVFIASIALLTDVCVNAPASLRDGVLVGDAAQALRLIEGTTQHSHAAAQLYESLLQLLEKKRAIMQDIPNRAPVPRAEQIASNSQQSLTVEEPLEQFSIRLPSSETDLNIHLPEPIFEGFAEGDLMDWSELIANVEFSSLF